MKTKEPFVLVILDGFGYRQDPSGNAILHAQKPTYDYLWSTYPHTTLEAAGRSVGLLPGMIGNSEVGHFTIGAGRVVPQPAARINQSIDDGTFFTQPTLQAMLSTLKSDNTLHIMGLLSDAGVHSCMKQVFAFIKAAHKAGVKNIVVHPFLDGRDSPPKSAALYLEQLSSYLNNVGGTIGSLQGRFFAMDRDHNWERTEQSYRVMTEPQPIAFTNWQDVLAYYYDKSITDEFIPPTQLSHRGVIHDHDGIIFYNFRPDRARQLTAAFIDPQFNYFERQKLDLSFFITPVSYGLNLHTTTLFDQKPIDHTLKEVLDNAGKTIFSIAETEKYAHVTYFFDGGKEQKFTHEERVLIPSLPLKNYIEHPAMSADKITDAVLYSLAHDIRDFYLINYANADMVGHSGDFDATVKAIECLDHELQRLYDAVVVQRQGTLIITADHGNAEEKYDPITNQPHTAHTVNPVPFIFVKQGLENKHSSLPHGSIASIAPFILAQMGIEVPKEMK